MFEISNFICVLNFFCNDGGDGGGGELNDFGLLSNHHFSIYSLNFFF